MSPKFLASKWRGGNETLHRGAVSFVVVCQMRSRVVAAVLLFSFPLFSQLNTGRISGAVTDQSGGAISGAKVTVTEVATGAARPLTSDSSGQYAAPNLNPGIYTLRAEFMGFQTLERQNIEVGAGGDVRVDVTLQPGQQNQTITVTESLPLVNTTNAQTGGTLENNMITNVPLNGRNYRWMVQYVPGIMTQPGEGTSNTSVNGGGTNWANYMIDGLYDQAMYADQSTANAPGEAGDTTILPLDAIQEVALVSNPKAEYGWNPGVTLNVALKSGTNSIHGSAFAFGRNQDLDAKNNFAASRPSTGFEQFGGSFGGPIKKDKIFFFGGYEGVRLDVTNDFALNNSVPSQSATVNSTSLGIPAAIADINTFLATHPGAVQLNQLSLNILGCGTAASYAGKITAAAVGSCTVNPQGAGSLFSASSGCTLTAPDSNTENCSFPQFGGSDNFVGKVDYHINDHNTLNGSYFFGRYHEYADASTAVTQPYWDEVLGVRSQMARLVEIWTPNSSWLNEVRVGWDHASRPVSMADCSANGDVSDPLGLNSPAGQFGAPNYATAYGFNTGTGVCGMPTIKISKLATLSFGNNRLSLESDYQGSDTVSYTRGTHQFKFGVDARFPSFNGVKVQDQQKGTVTFGASGAAAFSGASALESFIAGFPSSRPQAGQSHSHGTLGHDRPFCPG